MITTDQDADHPGQEPQPTTQTPIADPRTRAATSTSNQRQTTPPHSIRHHPTVLCAQTTPAPHLNPPPPDGFAQTGPTPRRPSTALRRQNHPLRRVDELRLPPHR